MHGITTIPLYLLYHHYYHYYYHYPVGKKKKKFRHSRSISTMVVANKGLRPILATGGVERVIKLWDVNTGKNDDMLMAVIEIMTMVVVMVVMMMMMMMLMDLYAVDISYIHKYTSIYWSICV